MQSLHVDRRRRLRRTLAGAVVVAATAAGCTSHAGAAAQVGDNVIASSTLAGLVNRGVAATAAYPAAAQKLNKADLQRRVLTLKITYDLVQREAASLGVTVSAQDVDVYTHAFADLQFGSLEKMRSGLAQAGIAPGDLGIYVRADALQEAIEDKLSPAKPLSDATARTLYSQVVGQLGPIDLTFEQAKPWIVRFSDDQTRAAVLQARLQAVAKTTKVSVNPRFGAWDPSTLSVVAASGSVATKEAPAPGGSVSTGQ